MHSLTRSNRVAIVAIVLFWAGCAGSRTRYEVAMHVDDGGMHRSLTGWIESTSENGADEALSESSLDHLQSVYGEAGETVDGRTTFTGSFDELMPQDVGGYGYSARYINSLGTLRIYSERFRGSDDLVGQWEEQVAAVDRFCELLGDWAATSAADRDEGASIKAFVNGPFRDDLLNVGMYCYAFAIKGELPIISQELKYRLTQFGVERGYLDPGSIEQAWDVVNGQDGERSLQQALQMLDRRRGPDETPLRDLIPALASAESFQMSLNAFLRDTPEAAEMRENSRESEIEYSDIFSELLGEIILFRFSFNSATVTVILDTHVEPYETNGTWDETEHRLTWEFIVAGRDDASGGILPNLCYASWTEPDDAFQREHFGRVVFTGKLLAEYILWYEGLDESEAEQWDRFIASISPADDLNQAFLRFRFDGEPASSEDSSLLSDIPRRILQNAISSTNESR